MNGGQGRQNKRANNTANSTPGKAVALCVDPGCYRSIQEHINIAVGSSAVPWIKPLINLVAWIDVLYIDPPQVTVVTTPVDTHVY
jgi:hypothetical protein